MTASPTRESRNDGDLRHADDYCMKERLSSPTATSRSRLLCLSAMLVFLGPIVSLNRAWILLALAMLLVGGIMAAVACRAWVTVGRAGPVMMILTIVPALGVLLGLKLELSPPSLAAGSVSFVTGLTFVLAAALAVALPTTVRWGALTPTRLFVTIHAILLARGIPGWTNFIDVWVFLTDSASALLHLRNPYALTFVNIYGPAAEGRIYGAGVIVDGRISYGFPYPPFSALWAVPGYLLGDVRISGLLALTILAVALAGRQMSRWSRLLAVLVVLAPGEIFVITDAWTEPSIVALLGLSIWAMHRGHFGWAAVLLGIFFSSKQYLAVALPCLWLLRPLATRRNIALLVSSGLAVTLPLALVDPYSFWRAVVQWQLIQPFRPDSLSLLVSSVQQFGWPSPSVYSVLPVFAGVLVAVVFSYTTRPGPAQFAVGVGLSLLVTILLSKQAFINYYFLVGGAFLLAAWVASVRPVPAGRHRHGRSTQDDERPLRITQ